MISKNISKNTYEQLKERFKDVASWAIWKQVGETDKSNTGDMSIFSDKKELKKLNNKVVFVALNASVHAERDDGYVGSWRMFHSDDDKKQQDYRLRYQLVNTPFEGHYITDVIKNHPNKDSTEVVDHINANPEVAIENIKVFKEELEILGGNPVIIAIGGAAHKILKDYLDTEHTLLKVTHYAHYISKERLRENTLNLLLDNKHLTHLITSETERKKLIQDRDDTKVIADELARLRAIEKAKEEAKKAKTKAEKDKAKEKKNSSK